MEQELTSGDINTLRYIMHAIVALPRCATTTVQVARRVAHTGPMYNVLEELACVIHKDCQLSDLYKAVELLLEEGTEEADIASGMLKTALPKRMRVHTTLTNEHGVKYTGVFLANGDGTFSSIPSNVRLDRAYYDENAPAWDDMNLDDIEL